MRDFSSTTVFGEAPMNKPRKDRREPDLLDLLRGFGGARRTEGHRLSSADSTRRTPGPRTVCFNAALGTVL
jgi:hypothetical protein